MKWLKRFIQYNYLVIFVFCLIIVLRFIWIDKFPPGLQYDEVEYSLSGKTYQMMGKDLSGVGFPQSLVITNTLGKVSPIPYMILSPVWNLIDLNMASYRSLYVILNIVTAIVFMFLLHGLFKKKEITFLGGILFLLNPWSFFLSRHGMDGSFTLLFYLLGTIFLLKNYSVKNIFVSYIFFLLGCFSYHGGKLYLVPFVTILSLYIIIIQKIKGKKLVPYLLNIVLVTLTVGGFIIGGKYISGSILDTRSHEFVFTNTEKFSEIVNTLRSGSIQSPLLEIMVNKFIYASRYFFTNYLEAFSPILLFIEAEVMEFHGFFYIFEIAFLVLGAVTLFHKNRRIFWLITALTVISPLTTATSMSGFSVINRSILLLPMLLIYITYGLYVFYLSVNKYLPQKLVVIFIGLLYAVSYLYFQYIYFFIIPIQMIMHYQTNTRVMAKYLSLEKKLSSKIIVVSSKPQVLFSGLVFYLPRNEQEKILRQKQTFKNNSEFTIGNITFTQECFNIDPKSTYIIDYDKILCYQKVAPGYLIINQKDAAANFSIVRGKACRGYKLARWIYPHRLSDFSIENMSKDEFCKRWIARDRL